MDVILHYDSGFPTRLVNHPRLAGLIERDGPPNSIDGFRLVWVRAGGSRFVATWDYELKNPWPGDNRKLVHVELSPKK